MSTIPETHPLKGEPSPASQDIKRTTHSFWPREPSSTFRPRALGITWENLSVKTIKAGAAINESVLSQFNLMNAIRGRSSKASSAKIIDRSHGCVKPGEMLLVLGRPGSGCSTLLRALANKREGSFSVAGNVHYGSVDANEASAYRGQIILNTEDELLFPGLTVQQTLDFAAALKTPIQASEDKESKKGFPKGLSSFLMQSLGILHAKDTRVGNEHIRGVSGGERKRVSIAECLTTRGSVYCWDNSTRGLDASTALKYVQLIRTLTDELGLSTIVSLYQAGNGIYNLFDKVLVLDEGKQIFYGPLQAAKPYMEKLGFICEHGSNVADFLTGVCVPTERNIRPEYCHEAPNSAESNSNYINNKFTLHVTLALFNALTFYKVDDTLYRL